MRTRFLLDENLPPRLKRTILRYNANIDVLRVGDEGAPALGTLDPDILRYVESAQRMLITNNRVSMPDHLAAHFAAGRHHWGIFHTRQVQIAQIVEAIALFWEASDAEEWIDVDDWIPF